MRDILEAALRAEPDDRALSAAYADLLLEEGDPRGELIRLQLLAEDPALSADDRAEFDLEIEELIRVHGEQWLGGLAGFLLRGHAYNPQPRPGSRRPRADWWFERGWLAGINGLALSPGGVQFLADAPETGRLRDLGIDVLVPSLAEVRETNWDGSIYTRHVTRMDTTPLDDSPRLVNLRRFRLGAPERGSDYAHQLLPWFRAMARIEELELHGSRLPTEYLFALRTLHRLTRLEARTDGVIAVAALAENPTTERLEELTLAGAGGARAINSRMPAWELPEGLPRGEVEALFRAGAVPALKVLRLHGSALGDRGVEKMLDARFVKRLTELELSGGCLTDAAARMFGDHHDTAKLKRLDLSDNAISVAAMARLRASLPPTVELVNDGQRSADSHVGQPYPEPHRGLRSRPRR